MFPFQFNKTSHYYIVFLYVTEVGTIHLYWENLRRNSKYYSKTVTRNATLAAEYMQRKIKSFQKNDIAVAPHQICNWRKIRF